MPDHAGAERLRQPQIPGVAAPARAEQEHRRPLAGGEPGDHGGQPVGQVRGSGASSRSRARSGRCARPCSGPSTTSSSSVGSRAPTRPRPRVRAVCGLHRVLEVFRLAPADAGDRCSGRRRADVGAVLGRREQPAFDPRPARSATPLRRSQRTTPAAYEAASTGCGYGLSSDFEPHVRVDPADAVDEQHHLGRLDARPGARSDASRRPAARRRCRVRRCSPRPDRRRSARSRCRTSGSTGRRRGALVSPPDRRTRCGRPCGRRSGPGCVRRARHVCHDAHHPVAARGQVLQRRRDHVERRRVERAEALVQHDRF